MTGLVRLAIRLLSKTSAYPRSKKPRCAKSSGTLPLIHHQPTVDGEGLPGHVIGVLRG